MKRTISFAAFGNATSLFLAITFAVCVGFDLLFPAHAMYQAWQKLLPGFEMDQLEKVSAGLDRKLRLRVVCHAHLGSSLQRVCPEI